MSLQSIYFERYFWNYNEAINWLNKHGFEPLKVDIKETQFRFRMRDPKRFKRFITKKLNKKGIYFVIGFKS
jgi:hypothetical protein